MTEKRMVQCAKLEQQLPGLEKAPFAGPLGQMIYERVSEQAWRMWRDDMQIKVLNEYRLNMGDKRDHQVLMDQMLLFLNLKSGDIKEVEDEERGRSGA